MIGDALRKVLARAKLNLTLQVVGVRPDGYHDLDSIVGHLSRPADVVTISPGSGAITVSGCDAPEGRENLVYKALEVLECESRFDVHIDKEIPPGAGLGGGSSDAAATLLALRSIAAIQESDAWFADAAATIGSDVPVCLFGGLSRMRGRGERVEVLERYPPPVGVLVVTPPFGVETASVFAKWDETNSLPGGGVKNASGSKDVTRAGSEGLPAMDAEQAFPQAPRALSRFVPQLANDLEASAIEVEPRLKQVREQIGQALEVVPSLAGSGSSYYVLFENRAKALSAKRCLQSDIGLISVGELSGPVGGVASAFS